MWTNNKSVPISLKDFNKGYKDMVKGYIQCPPGPCCPYCNEVYMNEITNAIDPTWVCPCGYAIQNIDGKIKQYYKGKEL